MNISISKRELSSHLLNFKNDDRNSETILAYLKTKYDFSKVSNSDYSSLQTHLNRHFIHTFKEKLKFAMFKADRFFNSPKNSNWLNENFTFSFKASIKKPAKSYDESSNSTKKRRIDEVLDYIPAQDLLDACKKNLRFSDEDNSESNSINNSETLKSEDETTFSPDEALAIFIDAKLTKAQYSIIRKALLKKNVDVLPPYYKITKAKFSCCPKFDVTQTSASTTLQSIVDHTAERILKIEYVKKAVLESGKTNIQLITKYGCDGTSGFTQYRQAFTEARNEEGNSVFLICMVPIFLRFSQRRQSEINYWENKYPSSTKLCRPVKFTYQKESAELISLEMENMQNQIRELVPTKICIEGCEICVNHILHCTMCDGKVRQVLTHTVLSQRCSICDALPSEMNNLETIYKKEAKKEAYSYGLSTLHAWIRNLEWVLHLSYKVLAKVEKYNEKLSNQEKEEIKKKKKEVIDGIRTALNILVDSVTVSAGNTNNGNTARKFFQNYNKVKLTK